MIATKSLSAFLSVLILACVVMAEEIADNTLLSHEQLQSTVNAIDAKTLTNLAFNIFGLTTNGFEVLVTGTIAFGIFIYYCVFSLFHNVKNIILPGLEGAAEGLGELDEKVTRISAMINQFAALTAVAPVRRDAQQVPKTATFAAPVALPTPTASPASPAAARVDPASNAALYWFNGGQQVVGDARNKIH